MDRQALTRAVGAAVADDPDILAVFLTGSIGRGEADEFSDVDFLAIVDADHLEDFASRWPGMREDIC